MTINKEAVKKISQLSRIASNDKFETSMIKDLNTILKFVDQLNEIDTKDIEPLSSVVEQKLFQREDVVKKMNEKGLGTSIYYPHPVPRMNYYKNKYKYNKKNFKNASIISDNSIALPIGPHLKKNQIIQISKIINNILKHYE